MPTRTPSGVISNTAERQVAAARPRLMAIGDSLAQGVQTMSFSGDLAKQSVSARLAQFNGWTDFKPADHPKPIIVNIEDELRHLHLITDIIQLRAVADGIAERIHANISFWRQKTIDAPSIAHPGFDNVGVAQAMIGELTITAGEWRRRLDEFANYRITGEQILNGENISPLFDIFKAINFSYTINPGNETEKQDWCVLDAVKARRPERLLVSIGHNEGLFSTGFSGVARRVDYRDLVGIEEVAHRIASYDIDCVIWDLLPKVGAVASLEPQGRWVLPADATHSSYAENYVTLVVGGRVPGHELRAIDDSIRQTNEAIKTNLGAIFQQAGKSIHFFDDFELLHNFDYKNEPLKDSTAALQKRLNFQAKIKGKLRDVQADNRYIFSDLRDDPDWHRRPPAPGIRTLINGGMFSGDGMHPTGLGYMHKALQLQKVLNLTPVDEASAFQQAYEECAFLSNFPTTLNTLALVLRFLHGAGGVSTPASALRTAPNIHPAPGVAVLAANLISALAPSLKPQGLGSGSEFARLALEATAAPHPEKVVHVIAQIAFNPGISFNDWSLDLELETLNSSILRGRTDCTSSTDLRSSSTER